MLNKIALKIRKAFPNAYQILLNIKQGRYNYTFSKEKYPHSFLANEYPNNYTGEKAPEVIYCFWTGDNPLTENRKKGLEALEKKAGIPVKLITQKNLPEYIKPDFPLHKGYELLSYIHRSDYLRCYFMHHYGGGYADIKPYEHSWRPAFNRLNSNQRIYALGYPERYHGGITNLEHNFLLDKSIYEDYENILDSEKKMYQDVLKHIPLIIGTSSFICKPNTPFTKHWYEELHKRMDKAYNVLEYFNTNYINDFTYYSPDSYLKSDEEYPIPYFHLLAQILHPISLKYHKHILMDRKIYPVFKDYR